MQPFWIFIADAATTQAAPPEQDRMRALVWCGVLLVVVVVGYLILMAMRGKFVAEEIPEEGAGFTLQQLHTMRDRGELTASEYTVARNKVVAKMTGNPAGFTKGEQIEEKVKRA